MAVDPIDTAHLGDLFGTAEMRAVFDETATIERYLEVEKTLARVEAQLGLIPREAAEAIAGIGIDGLDLGEYAERVAVVGFPIAPLVAQLARLVGDGYGEYAHWGATSQDIMDTALVLQLRDAIAILERDLARFGAILAALAAEHESTYLAAGVSCSKPYRLLSASRQQRGWQRLIVTGGVYRRSSRESSRDSSAVPSGR